MKKVLEFDEIAEVIINKEEYKRMAHEKHHGLTRYEHSLRVAKTTYKITKKLKLDYVSATRAALLHDFFVNEDFKHIKDFKKLRVHPQIALDNAKAIFPLNKLEENAIETHMFPLTVKIPTSIEGAILSAADKTVALYECSRFKLSMTIGIWILFAFNFLTISNK